MKKVKLFFYKATHWEYWPFGLVYFPMFFVWLYYSIRARTFFFFLPANPGIQNAGFLMESKKEIYDNLPAEFVPKTILVRSGAISHAIIVDMNRAGIGFPCIAKPDIGMKGLAVSLLDNEISLAGYAARADFDFLIQEYISLPEETGIFFYKMPGNKCGHISGITKKEFLSVKGDGHSSLSELIEANPRYRFQLPALQHVYGKALTTVLQKGELKTLVPYGNHARGAKFMDITRLSDRQLEKTINAICDRLPGFYFGRLDIRYRSWEELKEGKAFSIIELNGAGSEPTHIYDPRYSLLDAWKEIARHYKLLFLISRRNHRSGHPDLSFRQGWRLIKANKKQVKKLEAFSRK